MTDRLTWPRRIAVVAALIAIAAFFLPYISATDDYRESMRHFVADKLIDGVDITVGEMMDLSLFKRAGLPAGRRCAAALQWKRDDLHGTVLRCPPLCGPDPAGGIEETPHIDVAVRSVDGRHDLDHQLGLRRSRHHAGQRPTVGYCLLSLLSSGGDYCNLRHMDVH